MSEYFHVGKPSLDQLATLGWTVIDQGHGMIPSDPAVSLRNSFREWLLPDVSDTEIFRLQLTALAAGATTITSDAGEDPFSQIVAFGRDEDLRHRTSYGDITLSIGNPDLTALAFDASPDHVLLGQTDVSLTIGNVGDAGTDPFRVDVVLSDNDTIGDGDDQVVYSLEVPALAAGQLYSDAITLQLDRAELYARSVRNDPPGYGAGTVSSDVGTLGLVIDPLNAINETDEFNNANQALGVDKDDITYFPFDINRSGQVTPTDVVYVVNRLGGSDPLADLNANGNVTPTDAIAGINRLGYTINLDVAQDASTAGGSSLSAPFPTTTPATATSGEEDRVDLSLHLVDLDGVPGIVPGELFDIDVHFVDLRSGLSVFSAYADIHFDAHLLQVNEISYGSGFANAHQGEIDNITGVVDEVGATDGFGPVGATLVFTLHAMALSPGSARINSDAGESFFSETGVFGSDLDQRHATRYGDLDIVIDDLEAQANINVQLVVVPQPTVAGTTTLPHSIDIVPVDSTYFVEVWVQDVSHVAAGITGGFVDLSYTTEFADALNVFHDEFTLLTDGVIDDSAGLIDDLGGATLNTALGHDPEWARLGYVEVVASALGDVLVELAPGKLPFARNGHGEVPWHQVNFADPVAIAQVSGVEVNLTTVRTPTNTASNGEVSQLPDSEVRFHEWEPFWVEVWLHTPDSTRFSISDVDIDLRYDTRYGTASSIEYGPAFDPSVLGIIDDGLGVVENLSGTAALPGVGDDAHVLFARILFEPTADDQAPVDETSRFAGPYALGLHVTQVQAALDNGPIASAALGQVPDVGIVSVIYDLDDNDRIDLGDFSYFAPAFGHAVGEAEQPSAWWADFDGSGLVDIGDFSFFAPNFGLNKPSTEITLPNEVSASGLLTDYPPPASASDALSLDLRLVATRELSTDNALPAGLTQVEVGKPFFIEMWARDNAAEATGISGVFADLSYDNTLVTANGLDHAEFTVLASGDWRTDFVDDLGGLAFAASTGSEWVRVTAVAFTASAAGDAIFDLSPGELLPATHAIGNVAWEAVSLQGVTIEAVNSLPWQNHQNALDVNGDGVVSPLDALQIINEMNERGARLLPDRTDATAPYLDTTGDRSVSPLDALLVINHLNGRRTSANGEASVSPPYSPSTSSPERQVERRLNSTISPPTDVAMMEAFARETDWLRPAIGVTSHNDAERHFVADPLDDVLEALVSGAGLF
ncbi:MAG: dockerin type I domain-containing protein [Planctomycetota bacterium]|nr:dockerin type I domain-containing protein [Planctomycetota bacterium]